MAKHTLYIDESGQTGLRNDKASEHLTLVSVLISDHNIEHYVERLVWIREQIGRKDLHCSRLNHRQKVFFARESAKEKFLAFGVMSRKATLGDYRDRIDADPTRYYNKCAHYLLECVGEAMCQHGIAPEELAVIFEEGHFNYGLLRTYIRKIQEHPINERAKFLRKIDVGKLSCAKKKDSPLLQIADLVAHALYAAIECQPSNFGIPEPRYLNELRDRFYFDNNSGKIVPKGIKPIHTLGDFKFDPMVANLLVEFTNKKKRP